MSPSRSMATPLLHLATLLLLLAATSAGAVAFPTGGRPGNGGGDRCPWIDQRARASRTDAWRAGETDQDRSEPSHPTTLTLCDYYPRQPNPPSPAAAVTITRGSIGSPSKSPTMDSLPNPPSSVAAAAAAVPFPIDPDEKRTEEPVAKVSQKMSKLSVSSEPKKVGGTTRFAPEFRYHGCSWPEVVGLKVEEAERIIKEGKPDLYISVVPENTLMTMEYSIGRVRVIVDKYNRVDADRAVWRIASKGGKEEIAGYLVPADNWCATQEMIEGWVTHTGVFGRGSSGVTSCGLMPAGARIDAAA